MSGKVRHFSVSAYMPIRHPFLVHAHSKIQLLQRLSLEMEIPENQLIDAADALWKGHPVFLTDIEVVLLPGRFQGISYQMLVPPYESN